MTAKKRAKRITETTHIPFDETIAYCSFLRFSFWGFFVFFFPLVSKRTAWRMGKHIFLKATSDFYPTPFNISYNYLFVRLES